MDIWDRPKIVVEPGRHAASLRCGAIREERNLLVTGGHDRTVRFWDLNTGRLRRTIFIPSGDQSIGKVEAIALSPNGALCAVAGRFTGSEANGEIIWLFDTDSGRPCSRITNVNDVATNMIFSICGEKLHVVSGRAGRLETFGAVSGSWANPVLLQCRELGRLALTMAACRSGALAVPVEGAVHIVDPSSLRTIKELRTGGTPLSAAFHPVEPLLAVGFRDSQRVEIWNWRHNRVLHSVDTRDLPGNKEHVGRVAWSRDGAVLYAAGRQGPEECTPVYAWDGGGTGARSVIPAGASTVFNILPLNDGSIVTLTGDPWLGRIAQDGNAVWAIEPAKADFRFSASELFISESAEVVEFSLVARGRRYRFDVRTLTLEDARGGLHAASLLPTPDVFEGEEINVLASQMHGATESRWVGRSWSLGVCRPDPLGELVSQQKYVIGPVWALNPSRDGRTVVAAMDDGTLRWFRAADLSELLSFFPAPEGNSWLAWTPDGYYAASGDLPTARWFRNRNGGMGFVRPLRDIPGSNRPDVVRRVVSAGDEIVALGEAEKAKRDAALAQDLAWEIPAGANLHVLAIGAGTSSEGSGIDPLPFAATDAARIVQALRSSQVDAFEKVMVSMLKDKEATRATIFNELQKIRWAVDEVRDTVVFYFAGHGFKEADGDLRLACHDSRRDTPENALATTLSATELERFVGMIAESAKVLVIVDACHAGYLLEQDEALPANQQEPRYRFSSPNTAVLVACGTEQSALEVGKLGGGVFTTAVIDSIHGADEDMDGFLTAHEIREYCRTRVQDLVLNIGHDQTPDGQDRITVPILVTAQRQTS